MEDAPSMRTKKKSSRSRTLVVVHPSSEVWPGEVQVTLGDNIHFLCKSKSLRDRDLLIRTHPPVAIHMAQGRAPQVACSGSLETSVAFIRGMKVKRGQTSFQGQNGLETKIRRAANPPKPRQLNKHPAHSTGNRAAP